MKFIIQKSTGLDETSVYEVDGARLDPKEIEAAYAVMDKRLWQTNAKIVEVREWISQIKDPNYRYLFVSFMDSLMGVSSQAESLAQKYKEKAPDNFDAWMSKQGRNLETVKK